MQVPYPQQMLWQPVMTSPEHFVSPVPTPSMVYQHHLTPEGLVRVPLILKDGWMVQGIHHDPTPTYIPQPPPQPLHYVTLQPTIAIDRGHLNMTSITESLPGRQILVPGRPSGSNNSCGRTLRGTTVGLRRPSEEYDVGTPVKKLSIRDEVKSCAAFSRELLDPKLRETAILETIEFYFSDESLAKNAYLLKQVSQQEDGFVSLKRVCALKRLKSLTRDERVVAECVRRSQKLELNHDSSMVRRKKPLPSSIEPPRFIRSVIAINLPMETPTIESLTSLFGSYGDLTQVRVLKPGKKVPAYLNDYHAWIPDLGQSYCALVEFESQEEAQRACREINMRNRASDSLRVALLKPGARLRRTLYRKYKGHEDTDDNNSSFRFCENIVSPSTDQTRDYDASGSGSSSDSDSTRGVLCNSEKLSTSDSGYSPSSGDEKLVNTNWDSNKGHTALMNSQRALLLPISSESMELATRKSHLPSNILRYPIGPKDINEKGFYPGFRQNCCL